MSKPAETKTFTYPCGHVVTVKIDGRRHGGGRAACNVAANIRAGKKCVACRRSEVQARLAKYPPQQILNELMQLVALSDFECIADVLDEKTSQPLVVQDDSL